MHDHRRGAAAAGASRDRRVRRSPATSGTAVAAAILTTLLLAACGGEPGLEGVDDDAARAPASAAPADPPPPPGAPTPPPAAPAPDPVPPTDCADDVRDGVARTIDAQLAAFAEDDLAAAYALASRGFRGSVTLEQFEGIIRAEYSALLAVERHEVLECRSDGERAAVLVGLVDRAGTPSLLTYDLVREPEGWRVRGAAGAGVGGAPPPPAISA